MNETRGCLGARWNQLSSRRSSSVEFNRQHYTRNNEASCGWGDARRLIQRAPATKRNGSGEWIIQAAMAASNAAESSTLVRENIEHSCTHLLRAIINLETAGLWRALCTNEDAGMRYATLLYYIGFVAADRFFFSLLFSFLFFFTLSLSPFLFLL